MAETKKSEPKLWQKKWFPWALAGVLLLVVGLANVGSRANSVKLLLAGMAVSSVCSAFSNFMSTSPMTGRGCRR